MGSSILRDAKLQSAKEGVMANRLGSPKGNLIMAIAGWLGTAVSVYRIYTQSQKPDGDLGDAILNTLLFMFIAVYATIQYRRLKRGQ
jgi:hypothetical protein